MQGVSSGYFTCYGTVIFVGDITHQNIITEAFSGFYVLPILLLEAHAPYHYHNADLHLHMPYCCFFLFVE